MRQGLIIICLLASLAGCQSQERRDITAYSEVLCKKEGFNEDTAEFRGCVAMKVNQAMPSSGGSTRVSTGCTRIGNQTICN